MTHSRLWPSGDRTARLVGRVRADPTRSCIRPTPGSGVLPGATTNYPVPDGPPGPSPGVRSCAGPPSAATTIRRCQPTRPSSRGHRLSREPDRASRAASRQHAQRAARRGVAVLHEVRLEHGLSLGARATPCRKAPRREQAAAAHGPAHRVLHPEPASSSSTRSPASAERSSGRPSPSVRGAPSASRSSRAGSTSTSGRGRDARRRAGRARARSSPTSGRRIRPAARSFDPDRLRDAASATRWPILPRAAAGSVDFVATDPPYNIQLPLTMAGGALAEKHANRRTDYAMVTDDPADLANSPDYAAYLDRMETALGARSGGSSDRAATPASSSATPTRTAATCSPARTSRPAPPPSASSRRATSSGTRPARGSARTATRRRSCPNIAHQHILVLRRDR